MIFIFQHFLAYLESMKDEAMVLGGDKINLNMIKKVWKIVTKYLEPYTADY